MSKRKSDPKRDALWAEAKRLCRLNAETVRMAKELGFDPRTLIKNIPSKSQKWKAPVHVWIRDLYDARQYELSRRQAASQKQEAPAPIEQQRRGAGQRQIKEQAVEPVFPDAADRLELDDEDGFTGALRS